MTDPVTGLVALGAFLFGTVIGSFLNVVIARLPRRESVVSPASRCLSCGSPIRWHDNIPILSFLRLRGRCRSCGAPIHWRYPAVEAATGGMFALAGWRIGWTPDLIPVLLFLAALIAITVIDLEHQIIPDRITLPGIALGFGAAVLTGRLSWIDSVIGILLGGGIFFAIIVLSRGGMGGGDMKLGAMVGAFLGWKLTLVGLFVAVILGGLLAVILLAARLRGRKDPVPFAPFLAIGAVVSLFWGERILRWYLAGLFD